MAVDPELHVAVGLVRREGCFLLGSRDPDRPGGGIWEFPGGKLEAGETAEAALHRELAEEVGIHVHSVHTYPAFDHRQRDYAVRLYPFLVPEFSGIPSGLEGQALRWVAEAELWAEADAMPGANGPLLHHLAACGLFEPR
ncbi:MAG: (deoxy)nucleoside triphosphate pyrophosphohydrolase [Thiohalorhabdus sp.]|uniref:(deoxy)nucleoside triphosphate pyrophosphohydrolase n=1 Tax=Thiohalorhabdus sp. TaxID=3094134 RepID=UPI00397FDED5